MFFRKKERQRLSPSSEGKVPSRTICVPGEFPTIQEALDGARDGDTVIVRPGIYLENLDFRGKQVRLCSTDPKDRKVVRSTVIDGGHRGSTVYFRGGEQQGAVLSGFTITNGHGRLDGEWCGGGISILNQSGPVIEHNIVEGNCSDGDGAGIFVDRSWPTVRYNLIQANQAAGYGGGMHVGRDFIRPEDEPVVTTPKEQLEAFARLLDTMAPGQELRSPRDGLEPPEYIPSGPADLPQSTPKETPRTLVQGNTFWHNSAAAGGGLHVSDDGPIIEANAFRENRARAGGAVMLWAGAQPVLVRNQIAHNQACTEGGGIVTEWGSAPLLAANVITRNSSWRGAAIMVCENSSPVIRKNRLVQNQSRDGGAVFCWPRSSPVLEGNVEE
ncbi:MAG: right-handed parallel beta-helix repeat-containing protein [Bacillota bacterium]